MLERKRNENLIRNRLVALLVACYFLFAYFIFLPVKPVYASDSVKPYYETSNIYEDIDKLGITYDVSTTDVSLLAFLEYGYDKETEHKLYSLYLYVFIPERITIKENEEEKVVVVDKKHSKNKITLGFTDNEEKIYDYVHYNKYSIKYISSTEDNCLHKYQVNFNEIDKLKNLIDLTKDYENRVYCISDIELYSTDTAEPKAYYVNHFYSMSTIVNEKGSTVMSKRGSIEGVEITPTHVVYRTGYSDMDTSTDSGWQNQISSCYFSLPDYYSKDNRMISSMTAEFINKFSTPMLIVNNQDTYNVFKEFLLKPCSRSKIYPYFYTKNFLTVVGGAGGLTGDASFFDIFFNAPSTYYSEYINSTNYPGFPLSIEGYKYLPYIDTYTFGSYFDYLDWLFLDERKYVDFESPKYYYSGENIRNYCEPFLYGGYFDKYGNFVKDSTGSIFDEYGNVSYETYFKLFGTYYESHYPRDYYLSELYSRINLFLFEREFIVGGNNKINELNKLKLTTFSYNEKVKQEYTNLSTTYLGDIEYFIFKSQIEQTFWDSLWGNKTDETVVIKPFVKIDNVDIDNTYLNSLKYESFADKYYVDINEVPGLLKYAKDEKDKGKDTWLFRYDLCEYYGYPVTIYTGQNKSETGFVSRQAVYLDFDVLEFSYQQDGQEFVVPVNCSPKNVFNAITGAPEVLSWWEKLLQQIMLVLFFLVIAVVFIMCWPLLSPILGLVFNGAGLIIKGALKIVFLPAKIIFRKRPKNDDDS